jgi:hypothetical protein
MQATTLEPSQNEDDVFQADHCSSYANVSVIRKLTPLSSATSCHVAAANLPQGQGPNLIEKRFDPRIHIFHFPSAVQGK